MIRTLAAREVFRGRAALVVAHPDDETIAVGGSLYLLPGLLLVHVTDGAPRRLEDAARQGFETPEAYAEAREAELQAALALAPPSSRAEGVAIQGIRTDECHMSPGLPRFARDDQRIQDGRIQLGIPDQDAILHLRTLIETLAVLFRDHRIDAVLTHAYEGGHPDHDATALAVHRAAQGIPVFEFAGYHAAPGHTVMQHFLPGPPETAIALPPDDAARKRAMLACFRTQTEILSRFDPSTERLRPAPAYDFTQPPHPGPLNYETWGWELTGARWRSIAAQEIACAA